MSAEQPETVGRQPTSRGRLRRSGQALLRVGAVLLTISLLLTLIGGLTTRSLLNNLRTNSAELLDGTATVQLDKGQTRGLYVTGGLIAPGEDVPTPVEDIDCTVTGPGGDAPVSHLKDQDKKVGIDTPLARFQVVGSFTARAKGAHDIECNGLGVVVAPEVSPASALMRVGGLGLGSLGVFAGVTMLLIGGILTLIVRHGTDDDDDDGLDVGAGEPPAKGAEEWWDEEAAASDEGSPETDDDGTPDGAPPAYDIDLDDDYVELSDEELAALSEEEIQELVASGALVFVDDDDELVAQEHDDVPDEAERGDTYR